MTTFNSLGILPELLTSIQELGYEHPSPIQEKSIPVLLKGQDLLAQAQTGTGKTAAFALSILTKLDLDHVAPQAIVLAPTRELAIQVAESFKSLAKHLDGFHVLPIYGGQDYRVQLKALKRGVHVVVGTPGRVMDHLRRGTLSLQDIQTLVLDEADEMLKMGFIDDVTWILEQIPGERQTALFSATIPPAIKRIADQHLHQAEHIKIQSKTTTVEAIAQFYTLIPKTQKLEALTRFLETEPVDAVIVFVRTKNESSEIAEKLEARGFSVAAINGDLSQDAREKVIDRIKRGVIDIVVATDVAARGLDVPRITHVVNYDVPHDAESYVHRIGRTGRAGRDGKAILFVTPREQYMLRDIERVTQQKIQPLAPPSLSELHKIHLEKLRQGVISTLANQDLERYHAFVEQLCHDGENSPLDIAAALSCMLDKGKANQTRDGLQEAIHAERSNTRPFRGEGRGDRSRGSRPRGSFRSEGGGRGGFKSREDRGGERGGFKPREDRGGERGGFKPREDRGGERGGFKPREDRGGLKPRDNKKPFAAAGSRDDRPKRRDGERGRPMAANSGSPKKPYHVKPSGPRKGRSHA